MPAYRKFFGLVEEFPAIQPAVNVVIIKVQELLVEIRGSFSFHGLNLNLPAARGKVSNLM